MAVASVLAVVAALVWLLLPDGDGGRPGERPRAAAPGPAVTATPVPAGTTSAGPEPAATPPRECGGVTHPFRPRRIVVPGATRGADVVTPPRGADGVPGAPPLTGYGKTVFAWDRQQGVRPGDAAGNVLLNAHTWPDGSALGNRLLDTLRTGDRIVVRGAGARLCYRVTERVEVLASEGLVRYYDTDGPPQLAIVVCSGRRLGPGVWEKRTVWFASPAA